MKLLLLISAGAILAIVLLIGVIALVGSRLPKSHTASRSLVLHKPAQEVYAVIRDFGSAPTWRGEVKRVEIETQPDGRVRFREEGKNGTVNYELVEDLPAQRMVTRITDTDLGYSGQWTYVLANENSGTRLTITEDGEVPNVFFRFMSRYVFGHTATLDAYLAALAKRLGEK
jgi:uncharacterized membrane protein